MSQPKAKQSDRAEINLLANRVSEMKKILLSTAAILAFSASAMAADLYTPMPEPASAFSWDGFYGGVSGGYAWGKTKGSDLNGWTTQPGDETSADLPVSLTAKGDGFTGGGQIGYNFQMDQFVFGAEADISYLNVSGKSGRVGGLPAVADDEDNYVVSDDGYLGTVRGRLGFNFDRFLVYGTGGLAFGDTGSKWVDDGGTYQFSLKSGSQVGWTAGGGLEYAITDSMSLKAEYLYYDLGTEKVSYDEGPNGYCPGPDGANGNDPCNFKLDNTGSIVRVGVNFHF
jgi:outer membrane immunogenic protein